MRNEACAINKKFHATLNVPRRSGYSVLATCLEKRLLSLSAPATNRLSYTMMQNPKRIGSLRVQMNSFIAATTDPTSFFFHGTHWDRRSIELTRNTLERHVNFSRDGATGSLHRRRDVYDTSLGSSPSFSSRNSKWTNRSISFRAPRPFPSFSRWSLSLRFNLSLSFSLVSFRSLISRSRREQWTGSTAQCATPCLA